MEDCEVLDFLYIDFSPYKLPMIAIYYNPKDFPGKYVGRVYDVDGAKKIHSVAGTYKDLKDRIPPWMIRIGRSPNDDPCILETWL